MVFEFREVGRHGGDEDGKKKLESMRARFLGGKFRAGLVAASAQPQSRSTSAVEFDSQLEP